MKKLNNQKLIKEKGENEKELYRVAREAKITGFIKPIDLLGILIRERSYIDVVPHLPEAFFMHYFKGPKKYDAKENKVEFWQDLLRRWLGLEPDTVKKRFHPIQYISCYRYNDGNWEKLDRKEHKYDFMNQYFKDYINLSEFEEYIKTVEKIYQIQFPLPESLYSNEAHEDSTVQGEPLSTVFPCKPGTKWENITITLVANDMVRIKTPQGEGRFTYHELGLSDKRKGDEPKKALWGLFKLFAEKNNFISRENIEYDPMLPDTAKRLNAHLKKLFGIQDSIYKGHYKKEGGYRTKIKFSDPRQSTIISKSADKDENAQYIKEIFQEADKLDISRIGASQKKKYTKD